MGNIIRVVAWTLSAFCGASTFLMLCCLKATDKREQYAEALQKKTRK